MTTLADTIIKKSNEQLAAYEMACAEQSLRWAMERAEYRRSLLRKWLERMEMPLPVLETNTLRLNDQFSITVNESGSIVLQTTCPKCREAMYSRYLQELSSVAEYMRDLAGWEHYCPGPERPEQPPKPDPLAELQRQIAEAEDCNAHDKAIRKLQALTVLALVEIARRLDK